MGMRAPITAAMLIAFVTLAACTSDDRGASSPEASVAVDDSRAVSAASAPVPAGASSSEDAKPAIERKSPDCVFATADQPIDLAFCESFDAPTDNPNTRSGDLDATIWGVSRTNTLVNPGQGHWNRWYAARLEGCEPSPIVVLPPEDVRVCDGRLFEAAMDGGSESTLAMYPKQPFDIEGRVGTVVFDVSADANGPHSAWPEFWWTDQPVPAPHGDVPGKRPYGRNSFGVSIARDAYPCAGFGETGVNAMMITRDYTFSQLEFTAVGCVTKGTATGELNHFEIRLSENRAEVYGSDAGSTVVELLAFADLDMPLSRGVIWIEDVHYNGCKEGDNQCDHTFAWDNVGFDGPTPYRDLTFDAQDALTPTEDEETITLGFEVTPDGLRLEVPGVYWLQQPTAAYVGFNFVPYEQQIPLVRVNGGPWHETDWPYGDTTYNWNTLAVPVDMAEILPGDNTVEFKSADGVAVSNVNIILIAASPVP